jgi:hypothetical protein
VFIGASSEFGEAVRCLCPGEGVDIGDPVLEYGSPSERRPPLLLPPPRVARAAAVAAAASSTVPV